MQNEIRNDYRWLDALMLRCLEFEPERRFADAGRLLAAIEACEAGEPLPPLEPSASRLRLGALTQPRSLMQPTPP